MHCFVLFLQENWKLNWQEIEGYLAGLFSFKISWKKRKRKHPPRIRNPTLVLLQVLEGRLPLPSHSNEKEDEQLWWHPVLEAKYSLERRQVGQELPCVSRRHPKFNLIGMKGNQDSGALRWQWQKNRKRENLITRRVSIGNILAQAKGCPYEPSLQMWVGVDKWSRQGFSAHTLQDHLYPASN